MIQNATNAELLLADQAEEEYRSRGYEVARQHPLEILPGFVADLVARKDDEVIVMEVATRASLAVNPRINQLAQALRDKPGWTFELLLVGEPERLAAPERVRLLSGQEIRQRIADAKEALNAGFCETAFILGWTALEATIQELTADEDTPSADVTNSGHLLDQAVFLGVISREDYQQLNELLRYRNAVAHGLGADGVDDKLVTALLEKVRQLGGSAIRTTSSEERRGRRVGAIGQQVLEDSASIRGLLGSIWRYGAGGGTAILLLSVILDLQLSDGITRGAIGAGIIVGVFVASFREAIRSQRGKSKK